ncbi:hypothetical protein CYMTET_10991 [Cymbomonas tetramitiformis]|uniref:SET domain-containing protein n=1 Tax=Cymbomonas tetramitiformis TaxID=36881 RepID=A0AAE0LDF3_9CHLO|nr:hypothetical protein CYMTET_10991 [Cymbomonas tetramitiformis]
MLSSHVYHHMKFSERGVSSVYQLEVNKRTGWLPLRISSQIKCKSWCQARGPLPTRLRVSVRGRSHVQASLRESGEARSAETAEEEATRQWDELLAWVKEGGGYLGPSLGDRTALGQCELGDTGIMVRGLFPPEGCGAGDSLLGVPWHLALRTSELPAPYEGAPWGVTLAATVLRERAAGPNTRWASYVKTLPDLVDTPALLPPAMYDEIQYIPAKEALLDFLELCREAHSKCPAQMTGSAAWEQFLWAMTVVHSRSFGLKGGGGRIEGDRMMLPALDMLNHGNNPMANGRLALGKSLYDEDGDKGLIHIVSTRSLSAGEQVLFTYGPQERNNDDFFLYYGFTTGPRHPFEDFQLFASITEAIDWYLDFFSVQQPCLLISLM